MICGPGTLGRRLGVELQQCGGKVSFWGRDGACALSFLFKDLSSPVKKYIFPHSVEKPDVILLAVKAYQLGDALVSLQKAFMTLPPLVILANGFYDDELAKLDLRLDLIKAAVTMGGKKNNDVYERTDQQGRVYLPSHPMTHRLIHDFPSCFLLDEGVFRKFKWIVNCSLNTLCARFSLACNGEAMKYLPELRALYDEAFDLGEHLFPELFLDKEPSYQKMLTLVQDTAQNENSMRADLRQGRVTEMPYLSGLALEREGYERLREYSLYIQSITASS